MKKIVSSLAIVCSCLLAGNVFDYDQWAKDLQTMIELNQNKSQTLAGSDMNKNMVRDDVENYIKDKYKDDEFQKIMFLEAAKKLQQILTLPNKTSKNIHLKLDKQLLQVYTCRDYIIYKHSDVDVEKELEQKAEFKSKVLNTLSRLEAYISHKRTIPFKYQIPSYKELKEQKSECEKLYSKIKAESKKTTVLSVN